MVCRNKCERIYFKIVVGKSHYPAGKKYCRRCECYFITKKIFCQCCGMQFKRYSNRKRTQGKTEYEKGEEKEIGIEAFLAA